MMANTIFLFPFKGLWCRRSGNNTHGVETCAGEQGNPPGFRGQKLQVRMRRRENWL